jgi:hypothetical protein
MIMPALFDTIELLVDLPEHGLRAGARGAAVHQLADDVFEVEFDNEEGETVALGALHTDQFIVVWQAATGQPVSIEEQVAQIVARLPDERGAEVLDFARFVTIRADPSFS